MLEDNAATRHALVTDLGRLEAAGDEIRSGRWFWDGTAEREAQRLLTESMELDMYQTLMPAMWRILKLFYWETVTTPTVKPDPAEHASLWECRLPEPPYNCDIYVITTLDGSTDPTSLGPYPDPDLLDDLYERFSLTKETLLHAEEGWNLEIVDLTRS
jgi:hypothetical protein